MGLLLLYSEVSLVLGSPYQLILLPLLVLVVQPYIIRREEAYLGQAFGKSYLEYGERVPRWL